MPELSTPTDDWDNLCFNPHDAALAQGEKEGQAAGSLAGFNEGRGLGQTKGVEFGMELGFVRGVIKEISNVEDRGEKIQHSLEELIRALDDFPSPDQMFEQVHQSVEEIIHDHDSEEHDHDSEEHDHDSEELVNRDEKLNIPHKMQRIRARFKLLMVQLGQPHFSLKQVMDEANAAGRNQLQVTGDNEW
jgi:flagellar biosynthesis/type III secretory pathway protein FliH